MTPPCLQRLGLSQKRKRNHSAGDPNSDITVMEQEKRHDPNDSSLAFSDGQDDITGDKDEDTQRIKMSCGHAVTPESLTAYCRSLLDKAQYKFVCPGKRSGTNNVCGAKWPYMEVRRIALLTEEEQKHFEETMAKLASNEKCEYYPCPGCDSYVERKDLTNLCVQCTVCSADTGKRYEFCWQCLKTWKGRAPRSDKCDNSDCISKLELLQNCKDITLTQVQNLKCPSLRACPTCGNLVEHDTTRCKNIVCNQCFVEFCFSCLNRTADCLKTSSYFKPCPVAPRQTSIPTRVKN